jgi:hypothetical protein
MNIYPLYTNIVIIILAAILLCLTFLKTVNIWTCASLLICIIIFSVIDIYYKKNNIYDKFQYDGKSKVKIGTLNCLTDVSVGKGPPWYKRISPLKKVISIMNCDVICVQECDEIMINDLFSGSDYTTIGTDGGVQQNHNNVQTNMIEVKAPTRMCKDGENSPDTPCCMYNNTTLKCHYQGNTIKSCQSDPSQPIQSNIGYRILYKNTVRLVSGGRAQFKSQGGCPVWDSERFYEYADFQASDGNKFTVYGPHTSQSKNNNTDPSDEGWGTETNIRQNKEIYDLAIYNYNTYGNIPFVIAADLNYKADKNPSWVWSKQSGVNIDANMSPSASGHSVDYIISSSALKAKNIEYIPTTVDGVESTDHPFGLTATYSI